MPSTAILACLVIGIADGDTLTARCETDVGRTSIVIRLAEIDAPEGKQAFGRRSRQHLAKLCFKKPAHVTPQAIDRYGRTVAYVLCDRTDANIEQVRAGMAWAYTRYTSDATLSALEKQARDQRVGLWGDPAPVAPWEWRRSRSAASEAAARQHRLRARKA